MEIRLTSAMRLRETSRVFLKTTLRYGDGEHSLSKTENSFGVDGSRIISLEMLTPAFELVQDDEFLTLLIKVSFAKVSEAEIYVDGDEFKFYSSPYYLSLTLPGNIVEDGRESATYDPDKGVITARIPKEKKGQHFEGLDMITKLLAPKGKHSSKQPLIEVLDTNKCQGSADDEEDAENIDWHINQHPCSEEIALDGQKYGFANQRTGVFSRLQDELTNVVEVRDPDSLTPLQRREKRIACENGKFDSEHYLGDLYDSSCIELLLEYKPPWTEQNSTSTVQFSESEKDNMRKLPRKEYLLDSDLLNPVFLGLVDVVFAYAYNHRTTEGENSVESGWTISKLSSTLSWFETFSNLKDVVIASFRRCLSYPLYRHWKLAMAILRDSEKIFSLGRNQILKCLLETHMLLQDYDQCYILNDLYITDYCVWLQGASNKQIESLAMALSKVSVEKKDIGLNLEELEIVAGKIASAGDEKVDNVTHSLSRISLEHSQAAEIPQEKESAGSDESADSDDDSTESSDGDSTESSDDDSTESSDETTDSREYTSQIDKVNSDQTDNLETFIV